jgi:protease PrsW
MTASVAPRWGKQASLVQPREPAFWLYCALLAIGGYLFVQEQSLMSSLTTAYVLSWALVLAYAVPVALAIYWLDLFEREPKLLLAAAVLWGGVVATSFAAYANEAWLSILGKFASTDLTAQWGAAIVGPGVEETLKLMGVVIIFLIVSSEFDGVMDGFVYGAMVGLGFTIVEDVSYFINAVAAVPGMVDQSGPVLDTFLIRIVGGGLYGHVLFTGLTGTGFAYFATQRSAPMTRRVIGAGLCIVAGVAAHVVWNSPWQESVLATTGGANPSVVQWIEYGTIKGMPFLILLGILVMLATRSEEKNFQNIVAGEPDPTVINESEIRSLRSLLARRAARNAVGRVYGSAGRRLAGRLQAAQIEYALIRSRADSLDDPLIEAQRIKIRGIRAELAVSPVVGAPGVGPVRGPVQAPVVAPAPVSNPVPGQVPGQTAGQASGRLPAEAVDSWRVQTPGPASAPVDSAVAPMVSVESPDQTAASAVAPQVEPSAAAPAETAPSEVPSVEVEPPPSEIAILETASSELFVTDATPAEAGPSAFEPADATQAESEPAEAGPAESEPADATRAESSAEASAPAELVQAAMATAEAAPVDYAPAQAGQVESAPTELAPAEEVPEAAPVDYAPAEADQVESAPTELAPAEEVPTEAAPEEAAAASAPVVVPQSIPAIPFAAPVWAPTHVVPTGGLPAWDAPDPTRPPMAMLSERVELIVVARAGAWAQVRGVNGWTGWVDGRRIVERR